MLEWTVLSFQKLLLLIFFLFQKFIVHVIFSPKLNSEELRIKALECKKDDEKMKPDDDMGDGKDLKPKKITNKSTKGMNHSHADNAGHT